MKTCLLLIALAVLCLNVQATPAGYGSGYGSSGLHSTHGIKVVKPTSHRNLIAPPASVQMDSYQTVAPVVAPAPVRMDSYQTVAPVVAPAPVQMDSYGSFAPATAPVLQDTTVEIRTPVAIEELDPSLRNMCSQRQNGVIFYLPHPTKQSFYIQCDQFGQAFLKECPAGTIFTQNLVCENINDLHTIRTETISAPVVATRPVLDQTVGSYGAAPAFAADTQTTNVIETTNVETYREAPEFNGLCTSRGVFYFQHPTEKNSYIQCDEYGKAFLRQCPVGLVFTSSLVCENPSNLIETAPAFDRTPLVSTTYNTVSAPLVSQDAVRTEIFQEAPEFKELCTSKNTYGAQVSSVFYIPHPTKQSFYIQCDQFGRAFLKQCPAGTIFTLNLACENVNDLHSIEKETVPVKPQLDTTVGTYGTAPVFAAEANSISHSTVENVQEATEFKSLCTSKNTYGAQLSAVFYVSHPTNKNWYIQCNEFGNAFLKSCPIGTVFTQRMTCEREGEEFVESIPVVERPIVREQVVQNTYSQNIPVLTMVPTQPMVQRPVLREKVRTEYAQPMIQRPVLREQVRTEYAQPMIQRPVLREPVRTEYTQTIVQRPVLRKQVTTQFTQPMVQRPILREVVRPAY